MHTHLALPPLTIVAVPPGPPLPPSSSSACCLVPPGRLDQIVSRRKKRKDFEYECSWVGLPSIKWNKWLTRAELVEKGFTKVVNEYDSKLASSALGNDSRPLTKVSKLES